MTRDETTKLDLQFNEQGLISAIIQDAADGSVLMFAWMSAESLRVTQETGFATFWSRSRNKLWKKGEESGETFSVKSIAVDCDQDCLLLKVTANKTGVACHTGRRSCFYRVIDGDALKFTSSD